MYVTELNKILAALNDVIQLNVRQVDTLSMEITGTWVGTLLFEYTIDGHVWHAMSDTSTSPVTQTTANGAFNFNVSNYTEVRVRFNPFTSGTPNIFMQGKEEPSGASSSSGGGTVIYNATPPTLTNGQSVAAQGDINGNAKVVEQRAPGYEDNTANVAKVEQRGTPFRVTADGQVKSGAGFVYSIDIAPITATPTAGLLSIYDSLTEGGTLLYSEWVFATTPGHTIHLNRTFATGLFVGYDATLNNVQVSGSFR